MPKIKLIVVGATKSSFIREGESFYMDRLRRYAPTEWVEVKPVKLTRGLPAEDVLTREGQSIEKRLISRDYMIALAVSGKAYDSKGFADWIERLSLTRDRLCFVIGGPLGLSKRLLHTAEETLSLSNMTLTHEMSRILLLEQIYRAFTIIRGEKYHK